MGGIFSGHFPSGTRRVPLTDNEIDIGNALYKYWDGEKFDKSFDFKYTDGKRMEEQELKVYMEDMKKDYESDKMGMESMIKFMGDLKLQAEEEKELKAEEEKAKEKVKEMKRRLELAEEEERQLMEKRQKMSAKWGIEVPAQMVSEEQAVKDADGNIMQGRIEEVRQEVALYEKGKGREEEAADVEEAAFMINYEEKLKEEFIKEYENARDNFSGTESYKKALQMLTIILKTQLRSPNLEEGGSESGNNDYIKSLLDFIPKNIVPYLTRTLLDDFGLITNEFSFLNHFMPFYSRYMEANSKFDSAQTTEWPAQGKSASIRQEEIKSYLNLLLRVYKRGVPPAPDVHYLPVHSAWVLYDYKNGPKSTVPVVGRIIRDWGAGSVGWFNYRADDKGMVMLIHEKLTNVALVNGERQHVDGDDQMQNMKVTMFNCETLKRQCHLITYAKAVEVFFTAKGSARVQMFKYMGMVQKLEKQMAGYV